MSVPKVICRKVNKGVEQPVYVRYSHPDADGKSKDYFVATGWSIDPAQFKGGRVVGHLAAPEVNADIQRIMLGVEQAIRLAGAGRGIPYVSAVKAAYRQILRVVPKNVRLVEMYTEERQGEIQQLEYEVSQLLAQVEEKRAKIVELQKQTGDYQPELVSGLIEDYIKHREGMKPKNTTKRGKNSFSGSTECQYNQLKVQLLKFDPSLSIRAIDKNKMEEIEEFFIKERYYNSSTFTLIVKLQTILNHYQPLYELSKSYKDYSFELPMRDESVIYLTTAELRAFRNVSTAHRHPLAQKAAERTKDLALLMSETALRYSDSAIVRTDIQGGYIVKKQQKTGQPVSIPFTRRLQAICEKYDYKLKGGKLDGFNATFRRLLASLDLPSLNEPTTVINYIGEDVVEDTRPKYDHCGAHTLRRTMINQCLLRNRRYDQITKMTGHKDFEAFQTYIDRDTKAAEMDEVFDFLNEPEALPMMRVA